MKTSNYGETQVIDAVVGTDLPQLSELKSTFHSLRQPLLGQDPDLHPHMHSLAVVNNGNTPGSPTCRIIFHQEGSPRVSPYTQTSAPPASRFLDTLRRLKRPQHGPSRTAFTTPLLKPRMTRYDIRH